MGDPNQRTHLVLALAADSHRHKGAIDKGVQRLVLVVVKGEGRREGDERVRESDKPPFSHLDRLAVALDGEGHDVGDVVVANVVARGRRSSRGHRGVLAQRG